MRRGGAADRDRWALALWRKTAWLSERILHPRVFLLAAGSVVGVLAGTPTILWRPRYFFEAVNMYTTTYLDVDRMSWPVAKRPSVAVRVLY